MAVVARRKKRALILLPLVVALMLISGVYRWVTDGLEAVKPRTQESLVVELPQGASTKEAAALLEQRGLIRSATIFTYYARYRKLDGQLKPGEYHLSPGMTPEEILQRLARGEVVVYRFTIPEGLTVEQIADLLAAKKVVNRDRFLQVAAASHLADGYLPADLKLAQPLEGYLFPDTYDYKRGATEEELLTMMFQRFQKVWTPEQLSQAKALGLTVHQATTLASIVEKEAQVEKERPVIAGVYQNRLQVGMKLDADPTVRYAIKKPPEQILLFDDLKVESPYNTYRLAGLPPGPIAAPGEASIQAALSPAKHDFWYFVAKADGSGEHFFAHTLDEQDTNIARSEENAKKAKP